MLPTKAASKSQYGMQSLKAQRKRQGAGFGVMALQAAAVAGGCMCRHIC